MLSFQSRWLLPLLVIACSCSVYAVDGVVLIDQNRALAGNVTPGDTPGFPVTISLPGSYRLAGNLTVPDADTQAIVITADNVTLDLNGFMVSGPCPSPLPHCTAGVSGSGTGISSNAKNTSVLNGIVRGMGNIGVVLMGANALVSKVTADANNYHGISISTGTVRDSSATGSPSNGIIVLSGAAIGNSSSNNGGIGFVLGGIGAGTLVTGNAALNNTTGFSVACPSNIIGNIATGNSPNLVTGGAGCVLSNNVAP